MNAIKGKDLKNLEEIANDARLLYQELETVVSAFNERVQKEFEDQITPLLDKVNDKIDEFNQEINSLVDTAQEYYEDRSEAWQESERGDAYASWIDELGGCEFDHIFLDDPGLDFLSDTVDQIPDVEDIPLEPSF